MRRQYLPSSGIMLHSLVREALSDLVAGGPQNQEAAAHQILSSAIAAAANRGGGLIGQLRPANFGLQDSQQQRQPPGLGQSQAQLSMETSQSAPSVSLPPLSHFLVPRNPFRLFSSSSTPMVSRYRPPFSTMRAPPALNTEHQQTSASKHHKSQMSVGGANSVVGWMAGTPIPTNQQTVAPPFQGQAHLAGIDMDILASALGSQLISSSNGLAAGSGGPKVYAHSHSAEQLEKLIRAASRQTGMRTPTILPAIVSAPNGPMPGFYIPAIESGESESQISELRHGQMPAASASSGGHSGSPISKIPGTDYLLHPDEVRAMMSMGERAWRKQQQQQTSTTMNQVAESNGGDGQWQPVQQRQQQQQPLMGPYQQMAANLMQENHAQNARDFAYVDPQTRRDYAQQQHQADSSVNEQRIYRNQPRMNTSELEDQLTNHFRQTQMSSFPAVIRVNDQDYVHWPLINSNSQNVAAAAASSQRQFQAPFAYPNQQHQSHPLVFRNPMFALSSAQAANLMDSAHNQMAMAHQESRRAESKRQRSPQDSPPPEKDPVRLATQLTPVEIRQVEDSILEALIMAQAVQNQQRLVRLAEAASLRRPSVKFPAQDGSTRNNNRGEQHRKGGLAGGFFSRRRRSKRQPLSSSSSSSAKNQLSESPSQAQPVSLLPPSPSWLNFSHPPVMQQHFQPPIPVFPPFSGPDQTADLGEPLMIESRGQQRMPVVMADQVTNKQPKLLLDETSDAIQIFETAEASEPKVTSVLLNPAERIKMTMLHQSALDGSAATFGARVTPLQSSTPSLPPQSPARPSNIRTVDDLMRNNNNNNNGVTATGQFDEMRTLNDQLGGDDAGTGRVLHNQNHLRGPNRINVDWPGMVSDADYFPGSERTDRPASQPVRMSVEGSRNHADRLIFTSPPSGQSSSAWNPMQSTDENSRPNRQRPDHVVVGQSSASKYVASQLKLQFSPDYQAREGVPIYNNNVRVAGALDRQLPTMARGESSPRTTRPELEVDPADGNRFTNPDDEDPEESVAINQKRDKPPKRNESTAPVSVSPATAGKNTQHNMR